AAPLRAVAALSGVPTRELQSAGPHAPGRSRRRRPPLLGRGRPPPPPSGTGRRLLLLCPAAPAGAATELRGSPAGRRPLRLPGVSALGGAPGGRAGTVGAAGAARECGSAPGPRRALDPTDVRLEGLDRALDPGAESRRHECVRLQQSWRRALGDERSGGSDRRLQPGDPARSRLLG